MFTTPQATRTVAPIRMDSVLLNEIPYPAVLIKNTRITSYNKSFFNEFCELDLTNLDAFIEYFHDASWAEISNNTTNSSECYFCQPLKKYYQIKRCEQVRIDGVISIYFSDVSEVMKSASNNLDEREALFAKSSSFSVMEMATTLAHELNQPLATVTNFANVALAVHDADESKRQLLPNVLERIKGQAEMASVIVNRMREFVQHKSPVFEIAQVPKLISEAIESQRLRQAFLPVEVETHIETSLPTVVCDKVMIQLVLSNLLRNACDAMDENEPDERRILIHASQSDDGRVVICVKDNGKGIAKGDQNRVFQSFFTTKSSGMGAGLAICRSFVELHQGQLTFQSPDEQGCEFCFSLTPNKEDE